MLSSICTAQKVSSCLNLCKESQRKVKWQHLQYRNSNYSINQSFQLNFTKLVTGVIESRATTEPRVQSQQRKGIIQILCLDLSQYTQAIVCYNVFPLQLKQISDRHNHGSQGCQQEIISIDYTVHKTFPPNIKARFANQGFCSYIFQIPHSLLTITKNMTNCQDLMIIQTLPIL